MAHSSLIWLSGAVISVSTLVGPAGVATALAEPVSAPLKIQIDLSKPFNTRSGWRFLASQEPSVFEPVDPALVGSIPKDFKGNEIPGLVRLCLQAGPAAPCDPDLAAMPKPPAPIPPTAWEPHYLNHAEIVYPQGQTAPPLLFLQTASMHSGDGDQAVSTQLLMYDSTKDRFAKIYDHLTGHNNNQDVRFIASGPLRGSIISIEPTSNAPFAYWVTVNDLTPDWTYKQVLHYRSATRYGDGNELAVMDSEMPNIELRLGVWHQGSPLPLPMARPCQKPRLVHDALWCS